MDASAVCLGFVGLPDPRSPPWSHWVDVFLPRWSISDTHLLRFEGNHPRFADPPCLHGSSGPQNLVLRRCLSGRFPVYSNPDPQRVLHQAHLHVPAPIFSRLLQMKAYKTPPSLCDLTLPFGDVKAPPQSNSWSTLTDRHQCTWSLTAASGSRCRLSAERPLKWDQDPFSL